VRGGRSRAEADPPVVPGSGRPKLYALAFALLLGAGGVLVVQIPPRLPSIWASIALSVLATLAALASMLSRRRS
jgi:hypothetical protein